MTHAKASHETDRTIYFLMLRLANQAEMKETPFLLLLASVVSITLVYALEATPFLKDLSTGICYSVASALTGLAANFATSKIAISKPSELAAMLDENAGRLLVKRGFSQTFTRLFLWNVLVSFTIAGAGLITLGAFPIVWVFLNLGLFSPDPSVFRRYMHPWFETAAVIISAGAGISGGQRLYSLLSNIGFIPPAVIALVLVLHASSAMLETLEIQKAKGF